MSEQCVFKDGDFSNANCANDIDYGTFEPHVNGRTIRFDCYDKDENFIETKCYDAHTFLKTNRADKWYSRIFPPLPNEPNNIAAIHTAIQNLNLRDDDVEPNIVPTQVDDLSYNAYMGGLRAIYQRIPIPPNGTLYDSRIYRTQADVIDALFVQNGNATISSDYLKDSELNTPSFIRDPSFENTLLTPLQMLQKAFRTNDPTLLHISIQRNVLKSYSFRELRLQAILFDPIAQGVNIDALSKMPTVKMFLQVFEMYSDSEKDTYFASMESSLQLHSFVCIILWVPNYEIPLRSIFAIVNRLLFLENLTLAHFKAPLRQEITRRLNVYKKYSNDTVLRALCQIPLVDELKRFVELSDEAILDCRIELSLIHNEKQKEEERRIQQQLLEEQREQFRIPMYREQMQQERERQAYARQQRIQEPIRIIVPQNEPQNQNEQQDQRPRLPPPIFIDTSRRFVDDDDFEELVRRLDPRDLFQ
jgi:hypothetical protein